MHVNPRIARLLQGMNHPSLPGIDLSLERMELLLDALDNPQEKLPPVIHLAGTNGKGSTLAFLRAIYARAGYRVHAYTSPHLVRFNERIELNGKAIGDADLEPVLARVAATGIAATFFEATTAAAFLSFAAHPADLLLLETGLGGRLDATNLIAAPMATVLTPIDDDHHEFLGDSLSAIAREKAGIIKQGVPCFSGAQKPEAVAVIRRVAAAKLAPLQMHGTDWDYTALEKGIIVNQRGEQWRLPLPSLAGAHQHHNAALASVVARNGALAVPDTAFEAVAQARWPGRLQRLVRGPLVDGWNGPVYLDGGHNPHAAQALAEWIGERPVAMIAGLMARKDALGFFAPLAGKLAALATIPIAGESSHDAATLAALARDAGIARSMPAPDTMAALRLLQDCHGAALLVGGSLFLAGQILENHG